MEEEQKSMMELFMQLVPLLHRYEMTRRHGAFLTPHRGQGRVLSILRLKPEITQRELTYLLDMSKQAIGELLSKLESCGYITRTPSQEDGRVMLVQLTESGKAASQTMDPAEDGGDQLFQCLDETERGNMRD